MDLKLTVLQNNKVLFEKSVPDTSTKSLKEYRSTLKTLKHDVNTYFTELMEKEREIEMDIETSPSEYESSGDEKTPKRCLATTRLIKNKIVKK